MLASIVERRANVLVPTRGAIPYFGEEPGEFSDHALKSTAVRLPNERAAITLEADGRLSFPPGTILSKTFFYPCDEQGGGCGGGRVLLTERSSAPAIHEIDLNRYLPIETRLLVRTTQGWSPLQFSWQDGSPVHAPGGRLIPLTGRRTSGRIERFDYLVPSQGQCVACHQGARERVEFGPIGTNLHRLPSEVAARLLESASTRAQSDERIRAVAERRQRLGTARNYLDANCGYCHNPNGLAASSGLFLDHAEVHPVHLGRCKTPAAMGLEVSGASLDLVPGNPAASLIYRRMASTRAGVAMPESGRSLVDPVGLELVRKWIEGMPGACQ